MEIKVAVVILNWNGKNFLSRFLPGVLSNCPDYAQIVIADNASTDGSVNFLREEFPQLKVLEFDKNYGYTGGYNRAFQQIKAQYYVLLNSDIHVQSAWIEPVIELMDSDNSIAASQPCIRSFHQPEQFEYAGAAGGYIDYLGYPFCRGRIFSLVEQDNNQYNNQVELFWASGACMFVRAEDYHKAGGLDEDFFAHMEEIDLCWRLKRMGKKIMFCPDSVIYHVGGGTLPSSNPRKTFLNFRNNLMLLIKNLPRRKFYPILAIRIFLDQIASLKFLLEGQYKDSFAVWKAWAHAINSFRKKRNQGRQYGYKKVHSVYRKSIVRQYYLLKKKRFTDLESNDFGYL